MHGDGTYRVEYSDGDVEDHVKEKHIRRLEVTTPEKTREMGDGMKKKRPESGDNCPLSSTTVTTPIPMDPAIILPPLISVPQSRPLHGTVPRDAREQRGHEEETKQGRMPCPKCTVENIPSARTCSVSNTSLKTICSKCTFANMPSARTCSMCHGRLSRGGINRGAGPSTANKA